MEYSKSHKSISKFLSLVLRHQPDVIGLELDGKGWANVEQLLLKMNAHNKKIDFDTLQWVVAHNPKQRFSFSEDQSRIRANQGHSVEVELELEALQPPEILYHGTADRFLKSIFNTGLDKRARHHVHLSADPYTAAKVGARHGKLVILEVKSGEMYRQGYEFFRSENGVWLTDAVPVGFLNKQ